MTKPGGHMIKIDRFLMLLSNETRLRCVHVIYKHNELCVCELMELLDLSQVKVSRHLALLRESGLLKARKEKNWVYYQINNALQTHLKNVLKTLTNEIKTIEPYKNDLINLKRILEK